MDNYQAWVNSPENIRIEQAGIIKGIKTVVEAVERIRGAVPISITVLMLTKPITFQNIPEGDHTKIKYSMPVPEIAFRTEVVMRGHDYKRVAIVPLHMISNPVTLENALRFYFEEEYAPDETVLPHKA